MKKLSKEEMEKVHITTDVTEVEYVDYTFNLETMDNCINLISKKEKEMKLAFENAKSELEKLKETYEEIKSSGLNSPSTEYLIEYYTKILND